MKETDSLGIIKRVQADEELRSAWEKLSEPARELFREIDQKKRVPDILNDVMFMGVFDPEVRPEWLSKLISSVIGREVKVITSLVKEGRRRSVHSKGVIMDIPVQFLDVFRERRPHVAKLLENWMSFLSIRDVEEMMVFLSENPEFQPIYQRAVDMLADRKELLLMFQSIFDNEDIAGSINRTNESIIKRQERTIQKLESTNQKLRQSEHEKGMELKRKDQLLSEKDNLIEELQRQLAEAKRK